MDDWNLDEKTLGNNPPPQQVQGMTKNARLTFISLGATILRFTISIEQDK